ncbi:hypothetical protein CHUAL_011868 [Chamberlinius hualienensis]
MATLMPMEDLHIHANNQNAKEFVTTSTSKKDLNWYATKKTITQGMLDIALLTANSVQLKRLVLSGGKIHFYHSMLILISTSIVLQVLVGVGQVFLISVNINDVNRQTKANILNNIITCCVFVITVINVIIAVFGIDATGVETGHTSSQSTVVP